MYGRKEKPNLACAYKGGILISQAVGTYVFEVRKENLRSLPSPLIL